MNKLMYILVSWLALCVQSPQMDAARILATFPFPGRSQKIFVDAYLETLAERGHQVTVINTFENKPVPNITFITAPQIHEYYGEMLAKLNPPSVWEKFKQYAGLYKNLTECIFQDKGVQKLMKSGQTFDLVIAEMMPTEALFGFSQHFNATMIGVSAYGNDYLMDGYMGNDSPLSYNPLITCPRTEHMTFLERLQNQYEQKLEVLFRWLNHLPTMERMYGKYFPNAKRSLSEVRDSFSLMLLGQHYSVSYARPYLPNMIEVGGMHISHTPKPLPEDIKEFIESALEGVIYFSLGSNLNSKDLPVSTRDTLLKVFRSLKQRVLWKFEDEQLPGKPDNVFIRSWFPQPDILAHPNVKLFIGHGGLLSTFESVFYGKPILGLPVFFDQFMNVKRNTHMGIGLGLDLKQLSESQLEQAIHKLLNTPTYTETVAQISQRYHDQPESSMDRAIWWTEYVIRHRGATFMRAASRDLSYIQHHNLDTLGLLISVAMLLLFLLIRVVVWLVALVFKKKHGCDKLKRQ